MLGLVAAALGMDKHAPDEEPALAPLAALRLAVYRVDRAGDGGRQAAPAVLRLNDYHTVGGGYDESTDRWARLSTPRKASGGAFGTVLTQRDYLSDAVFAAVLRGPQELLETVAHGLADPVWGVWLGRKCCVPATPVLGVLAPEPADALAQLLTRAQALPPPGPGTSPPWAWSVESQPLARDGEPSEPIAPGSGADTRADQPLSYGKRRHASRTLRF